MYFESAKLCLPMIKISVIWSPREWDSEFTVIRYCCQNNLQDKYLTINVQDYCNFLWWVSVWAHVMNAALSYQHDFSVSYRVHLAYRWLLSQPTKFTACRSVSSVYHNNYIIMWLELLWWKPQCCFNADHGQCEHYLAPTEAWLKIILLIETNVDGICVVGTQ